MSEEINFYDLAALLKVKPDTTMERFGGMLNSSYFDGANVVGTLTQKKLVTFNTALPGQSVIGLTDAGKALIEEANNKAKLEFDLLDLSILTQVSGGKSTAMDIGKAVNVRPRDLAMHLFKLAQTDYISYEFRSGAINVMLTEKGFQQVKMGMPPSKRQGVPVMEPQQASAAPQQPTMAMPMPASTMPMGEQAMMTDPPKEEQKEMTPEEVEAKIKSDKGKRTMTMVLGVVVLIVLIGLVGHFVMHLF